MGAKRVQAAEQMFNPFYTSSPKADEQGDTDARFNLDNVHNAGQGVEQDNDEAAQWYQSAAVQEDAAAIITLLLTSSKAARLNTKLAL